MRSGDMYVTVPVKVWHCTCTDLPDQAPDPTMKPLQMRHACFSSAKARHALFPKYCLMRASAGGSEHAGSLAESGYAGGNPWVGV